MIHTDQVLQMDLMDNQVKMAAKVDNHSEEIQGKEDSNNHQTEEETHLYLKLELELTTTLKSFFVMLKIQFQKLLDTSLLKRVRILSNLNCIMQLTAISPCKINLENQLVLQKEERPSEVFLRFLKDP